MLSKKIKKTSKKSDKSKQAKGTEQFKLYGHEILNKVKELVKEGNVQKIIIKNDKGRVMMEIPVTFALIGTMFAPVLAAIGALAALLSKATIEVQRK